MLSVLFFWLQHSLPHLLNLTYIGNKSERESKLKSSATQIVIKVIKRWSNKNQKSWKSPQFLLSLSFPPPKAIYSLLAIIRMVAMITKVMTFTNYNWWWIELIETHTIRILNFCLAFFLLWRNVEKFLDIFHCLVHSDGIESDDSNLNKIILFILMIREDFPKKRVFFGKFSQIWVGGVADSRTRFKPNPQNHPQKSPFFTWISPWGGWVGSNIWENFPKKNHSFFRPSLITMIVIITGGSDYIYGAQLFGDICW